MKDLEGKYADLLGEKSASGGEFTYKPGRMSAPFIPDRSKRVSSNTFQLQCDDVRMESGKSSSDSRHNNYCDRRDLRISSQGKSKLRSFTKEGENFAAF